MEFEKEMLEIVNDTADAKMSKKATVLLSTLYTLEEKRSELKKKISNFILDYQRDDEKVNKVDESPLTEAKPKKSKLKNKVPVNLSPQ